MGYDWFLHYRHAAVHDKTLIRPKKRDTKLKTFKNICEKKNNSKYLRMSFITKAVKKVD